MHIEHITNKSGEWFALKLDGEVFYDGHSIPHWVWLDLIAKASPNVLVDEKEISDEDMEEGDY